MVEGTFTLAEIESRHYPVGMEINVEIGSRNKYEKRTHKVVEDHKHFVVITNGIYNYCISKPDLFFLPTIRVESHEDD